MGLSLYYLLIHNNAPFTFLCQVPVLSILCISSQRETERGGQNSERGGRGAAKHHSHSHFFRRIYENEYCPAKGLPLHMSRLKWLTVSRLE